MPDGEEGDHAEKEVLTRSGVTVNFIFDFCFGSYIFFTFNLGEPSQLRFYTYILCILSF